MFQLFRGCDALVEVNKNDKLISLNGQIYGIVRGFNLELYNNIDSISNESFFVAKKGMISIYVYKIKGPMREFADNFIRKSTVKMTEKQCIEFSRDMALLGKNLSKIKKTITVPKDIPLLQIKAGTYDVQRFIYWNFLKCWWSKDVPFEQSVATNFDWYFPEYAYRHNPKEVKKWFKDSKIRIVHFNEIESGISVNGKKP